MTLLTPWLRAFSAARDEAGRQPARASAPRAAAATAAPRSRRRSCRRRRRAGSASRARAGTRRRRPPTPAPPSRAPRADAIAIACAHRLVDVHAVVGRGWMGHTAACSSVPCLWLSCLSLALPAARGAAASTSAFTARPDDPAAVYVDAPDPRRRGDDDRRGSRPRSIAPRANPGGGLVLRALRPLPPDAHALRLARRPRHRLRRDAAGLRAAGQHARLPDRASA